MQSTIDVATGCVVVAASPSRLRSTPLGSCIAVVLLDPVRAIGGMAHVMLPGRAPAGVGDGSRWRYAPDAMDQLFVLMWEWGCAPGDLHAGLIGGANVLQRPDDTICNANIRAVMQYLCRYRFRGIARDLGGCVRRSAILDIAEASLWSARGGDPPVLLWCARQAPVQASVGYRR
ncbi:MAG TPA: hypothetical protein ENN87_12020 [Phycisphaerales bacterium]|nr:hypothetical protein [Phycisphaerales bacterium]